MKKYLPILGIVVTLLVFYLSRKKDKTSGNATISGLGAGGGSSSPSGQSAALPAPPENSAVATARKVVNTPWWQQLIKGLGNALGKQEQADRSKTEKGMRNFAPRPGYNDNDYSGQDGTQQARQESIDRLAQTPGFDRQGEYVGPYQDSPGYDGYGTVGGFEANELQSLDFGDSNFDFGGIEGNVQGFDSPSPGTAEYEQMLASDFIDQHYGQLSLGESASTVDYLNYI